MRICPTLLVIAVTVTVASTAAAQYVDGPAGAPRMPVGRYDQLPNRAAMPAGYDQAGQPDQAQYAGDVDQARGAYPAGADGDLDQAYQGYGDQAVWGGAGGEACDGSCGGAGCESGDCEQRAYILPLGKHFNCFADLGPYGDGTSAVHWFDVSADFIYLNRDDVSRQVDFASDGIGGPVVLGTNNLDFDEEPGFRVTGTYQISGSTHIEAVYMGTFNWNTTATATSGNDNLYSAISNFGNQPAGGFLQTDQSAFQRIDYSSDLNNVELNWRQHWMQPNYRLQGSWMAGVRYVRLREDLLYATRVNAHTDPITSLPRGPALMDYSVRTTNHLVGFQLGGDLFASLLPGLLVGGDLKAGIYGNHARQNTTISATNLNPAVREKVTDNDVSLVAEAGASVVYQITPWLSLKGGYELLYLDGVALAPENFNANAPFGGPRSTFVNDNGNVFYHGFTAGLEWIW